MVDYIKLFENVLYSVLILMLAVVLVLTTLDLGKSLVQYIITPPDLLLAHQEVLSVFSTFLLVLIGIEFFDTMRVYLRENAIHVEIIILIAIIAVCRKVILIDPSIKISEFELFGLGVVIVSLGITYYLIKKTS